MSRIRPVFSKLMVQYELFAERVFKTAFSDKFRIEKTKVSDRLAKQRAVNFATAKLKQLTEDYEANPLRYYCPNIPSQKAIHAFGTSLESSKIPIGLYSTGNGVGKSETALQIMANLILGPKNDWFDYKLFKHFPFEKHIWVVTTPNVIKDRYMRKFFIPMFRNKNQYKPIFGSSTGPQKIIMEDTKDGKSHTSIINFRNSATNEVEWTLEFKTFDQAAEQFESSQPGLIIIDEPPPEHIFRACLSRMRMGCIMFLPMTPLDIEPFIWEMVIDNIEAGTPGYFMVNGDVRDCSKKNSPQGHLDHDIMEQMIARYSEDEREARIEGKPTHFKERIYSTFENTKHIVSPIDFPIHNALFYLNVIDPKDGAESAIAWFAYMSNGRWIIFNELPLNKKTPYWSQRRTCDIESEVKAMIEIEKSFLDEENDTKLYRVMDRRFGWQSRGGGSLASRYLKFGKKLGKKFVYLQSYTSNSEDGELSYGHDEVRNALSEILEDGYPRLVVWDSCYHVINGFHKYVRRRVTTKVDSEKLTGTTKIIEKYKDFADVVRYGVCSSTPYLYESSHRSMKIKKQKRKGLRDVPQKRRGRRGRY